MCTPHPHRRLASPPLALLLCAGLLAALLLPGCEDPQSESTAQGPTDYPYTVVATVGMIGDVVRNVAGDKANVTVLIGAGADPHIYVPSRDDLAKIQEADVVFYNGLLLEGKMSDVLLKAGRNGKPVYAVTEKLQEKSEYVITDEEDHYDPHVWMDVAGWMQATDVVAEALSAYDPANAATYQANATAYRAELEKLHAYAKQTLGSIPEDRRVLITAHDAFGYLEQAYGIEVMGVQGLSTESEAGLYRIEKLVTMLVQRKIPAIFMETSVSEKNILALQEGAAAAGHTVNIGGKLFSDAMGPAGTYQGTYVGMIDHNVTTIARALGGQAPAGGMQGKLSP